MLQNALLFSAMAAPVSSCKQELIEVALKTVMRICRAAALTGFWPISLWHQHICLCFFFFPFQCPVSFLDGKLSFTLLVNLWHDDMLVPTGVCKHCNSGTISVGAFFSPNIWKAPSQFFPS